MRREHLAILLSLLFLCLAVRLFNFVGIGTNDDVYYIQNAQILASGNSPYTCQIGFRSGMVAPLALLVRVFGLNEKAFTAYPLICSLIACALIYLTAVRLWGMPTAIFASLLWIAYPLQIVFDTQLSPSNQQATCVAASLFFYSLVIKSSHRDFLATPVRDAFRQEDTETTEMKKNNSLCPLCSLWLNKSASSVAGPVFLMLSGVFLGFAWLLNEIFVTFVLVVLPFLVLVRPKIRHLLWITAGFALVFLLELLVVKLTTGAWFSRFTCILNTERVITSNKDSWYLPRTLFKVFGANPLFEEGHFGIIWYLFIIATVSTVFLKDKLALALAIGCWLWLAYIQWGGHLLLGEPIAKYIRYISMIVPLQCLVFGAVLGRLLEFSKKLKAVIIFLFVLLLIHLLWLGTKAVNAVRIHTEDFRQIAKLLLQLDLKSDDIVYTDFLTGDFVEIYAKGRLTIRKANLQGENIFTKMPVPEKGILVQDGSRAVIELSAYRRTMPQWYLSPPQYWPLLYTVTGRNIDVYAEFDPKIYKILPRNLKGDEN
jgi:hypothetical protein